MTEEEWNACTDPKPMVEYLRGKASGRKLRLFACACCQVRGTPLTDERSRKAVRVAERYADGGASPAELADAYEAAARACEDAHEAADGAEADLAAAEAAADAAAPYADEADAADAAALSGGKADADLLRDLFGSPSSPGSVNPAWLTPAALSLAQAAYEHRDLPSGHLAPARLVVLADALEDAGCTNADLTEHLYSPGPHVRGCWAVDLLLGKS